MEDTKAQTFEFKAEVKQLLDILARSLYTNREIFLRELISNASDALDKARFEMARGSEVEDPDQPLEIRVTVNKEKNTIKVSDTGIGMSRDEMIEDIGTIARSGSAEFLKQLAEQKDKVENIIGKFGVGFYSVFMVADRVTIVSKSFRSSEPPVEWRSDGSGEYQLRVLSDHRARGTDVIVQLKEDAGEFCNKAMLESIVKRHSNFISFPILVEGEQANTVQAIWREPKSSVSEEQYQEFYKFLTYDTEEPLGRLHISVDAPVQYAALLFIPRRTVDIFGVNRYQYGLDLYIRRVLIQHENKDFLPEYLSFVKGVVDCEDLPLNISRETLQDNRVVMKIRQNLVSQLLGHLQNMADKEPEKYEEFWREHGRVFKLGHSDYTNQEKFAKLLRFNSSHCEDAEGLVSFEDYIGRAKEGQQEIYYIAGESRATMEAHPHLEMFRRKGLEVLFLFEPIDEFVMDALRKYRDYELKSVEHVDPASTDAFADVEEKKPSEEPLEETEKETLDSLLARMKEILGDRVTDVRRSQRLTDSPMCLVNPEGGLTSHMQKMLHIVHRDMSIPSRVMEVNPNHRLIRNLLKIYKQEPQADYLTTAVEQLYESALLLEGYLKDPHRLVQRMNRLLEDSSEWRTSGGNA
jgi:molecular chaperone HtpG